MSIPLIKDQTSGILYRTWPAHPPKAAALLVHGLGSHSGRWEFLAETLSRAGISCYALELRGFGETSELPGHCASFEEYYHDIAALNRRIRIEIPDLPIFIVSESMGALISLRFILQQDIFKGIVCIAPALNSTMKFPFKMYMQLCWALLLKNGCRQFLMPLRAEVCTRDPHYQKILEEDFTRHRYASAALLSSIVRSQWYFAHASVRVSVPIAFVIPGKDRVVDPRKNLQFFKRLNASDKTLFSYPDMLHCPFVDIGKEKVCEDIAAWIEQHVIS